MQKATHRLLYPLVDRVLSAGCAVMEPFANQLFGSMNAGSGKSTPPGLAYFKGVMRIF
jgi:hypothetical protein